MLAVEQRLPRDLAEEGATFWADVINLELVSQRLQLHRDLGRLLGTSIDADGGGYNRNEQAQSKQRRTAFP